MSSVIANRRAIALFLVLFLLPTSLLVGLSVQVYKHKFTLEKALTLQKASQQIVGERRVIENTFRLISSDLFLLSSQSAISSILTGHAAARDYREAEAEFLALARFKGIYDQVRLIDAAGQERLRIDYHDGNVVSVPRRELQYKGDRYYFRAAMKLDRNEVYFSPFDLNIEHGAIEKPYKPMIRIAMPIIGHDGSRLGVLILNYLGQNILKMLGKTPGNGKMLLLNSKGYWLKGMGPEDEWGFMFPDGKQKTMAMRHPDVWAAMQQSDGHIFTPEGLFSFGKLYPMRDFHPPGISLVAPKQKYMWHLVNFVPEAKLFPESRQLYRQLLWRNTIAVLVWGIMAAFLVNAVWRKQLAEQVLRERNAYMREVLNNTFDGIVTVDGDGIIHSFNPAACRIFGYRRDEVIDRSINMLVPPEHRQQHQAHLETLKQPGEKLPDTQREVTGLRKDGSVFPMELSIGINQRDGEWMFTAVFRDITKRKQMEEQLERMATTDALTGASNRHSLKERLEQECDRARRYGRPFSLLMLDIDHFKSINDRFGHDAGDAYLVAFTKLLMQTCRETDTVYRYGGEEFLIVLPESDADHAARLATRLMEEVRHMQVEVGGQMVTATVSIGAALFGGQETADSEALLKRADQAVYAAKESGRDCFRAL